MHDLNLSAHPQPTHLSEAIQYRTLDRNLWVQSKIMCKRQTIP